MAGDWIKMRLSLVTHPKVMRMAEHLLTQGDYLDWAGLSYGVGGYPAPSEAEQREERYGALRVTRYVTVTALLRFWGYANEHAKDDETIAGLWPDDVDEIAGVPKFAEALKHVAWIEFDDAAGCAYLPNFCEHNVLAGSRSPAAERQKRYRENLKNRDVTRDVTVTPREEESREEKKVRARPAKKPIPKDFTISERVASWAAERGIQNLDRHFEHFVGSCKAKGYSYSDWDEALMGAIRKDWAQIGDGRKRVALG